jgi:hypothetical protein
MGTATAIASVPVGAPPQVAKQKPPKPTWIGKLEKWQSKGQEIAKQDRKLQWEIADWMLDGVEISEQAGKQKNKVTSEMLSRAEKATGLDRSTLKTWASVARNVTKLLRNNRLSFYHHKEVADLTETEKREWLEKAVADKLSVAALRNAIHASKGTSENQTAKTGPKNVRPIFTSEELGKIKHLAKRANKTEDDFVRDIVREYLAKCQ